MAPRMAYLGMGGIGKGMAKNLAAKAGLDQPLLLWNRTKATADDASASIPNSRVSADLQDIVATSDIIWSCLLNEGAVLSVYEQLLAGDVKGKLLVESSSIPKDTANALQKRAYDAGAEFVAVPVVGDPTVAADGSLITIAAGTTEAVERVKPYLVGVTALSVVDLAGQPPANALVLKLIGNTLNMSVIESIAESLVLAEKVGVGENAMAKLINAQFPLPPHSIYLQRMTSGQYVSGPVRGSVDAVQGVISYVMAMAQQAGAPLPAYEVVSEHMRQAAKKGRGQDDISSVYGMLREQSGLPYSNQSDHS